MLCIDWQYTTCNLKNAGREASNSRHAPELAPIGLANCRHFCWFGLFLLPGPILLALGLFFASKEAVEALTYIIE